MNVNILGAMSAFDVEPKIMKPSFPRSISKLALVLVVFAAPWSHAAQPLSAEQERAVVADVGAAMNQYVTWLAQGRADFIAERSFLAPAIRLDGTGPVVLSREELKTRFESALKTLSADGYMRSEWPIRNICALGVSAAIVSGRYVQYRKDGSVIGEAAATYMFAKTTDGWRIVSWATHDVRKVVQLLP